MIDAFRGWIMAESRTRPVLLLADDFQWMDSESETLLTSLAGCVKNAPVLVVLSSRSRKDNNSLFQAATSIRLAPLDPDESAQVLVHVMGEDLNQGDARAHLIARTAGNPLYLIEVARSLIENGGSSPAGLPPTVQAIIAARIDSLPSDEKALLQAAAVLGNEFELVHLAETVTRDKEEVRASLGMLQARGFVQERRIFPEVSFGFDQPLVLEVTYRSLLHEQRRDLHRKAFVALHRTKGESCALSLGSLAHHSFEAGLWEDAVRLSRLAARRAASQSAYREAAALYRSALMAAQHLGRSTAQQELEVDLRIELRHVLFPIGQFREIGEVLAEAQRAAAELGDTARLGSVLLYETTHHLGAGRHRQAIKAGVAALEIAERLGDVGIQRDVLFHLIQANASTGSYSSAIAFASRLTGVPVEGPAGVTTSALAQMWLAWCSAELGIFVEAHEHAEAAFALARGSDQQLPILLAHLGRGIVLLREERYDEAAAWLEPALSFSDQPNLHAWWRALGSPLGRAWLAQRRVADATSLLERVVEHSASSSGSGHVLRSIHLGEAYLAADRLTDAAKLGAEAFELARTHEERGHEAYALLFLAEIARKGQQIGQALQHAQAAEQLATALQMRPLQTRTSKFLEELQFKPRRSGTH
jgi:tetratricopeptide (TPR) repeat protein